MSIKCSARRLEADWNVEGDCVERSGTCLLFFSVLAAFHGFGGATRMCEGSGGGAAHRQIIILPLGNVFILI